MKKSKRTMLIIAKVISVLTTAFGAIELIHNSFLEVPNGNHFLGINVVDFYTLLTTVGIVGFTVSHRALKKV